MRDAVSTGAFLSAALTVGSDLLVDAGVDLAPVPVLLDVAVSALLLGVTLDELEVVAEFAELVLVAALELLVDLPVSVEDEVVLVSIGTVPGPTTVTGLFASVLILVSVAVSVSELPVLDWLVAVLLAGVLGSALLDELLVAIVVLLAVELELTVPLEELVLVAGSSLVAGVVGSAGLAGSSGVASGMSSYHIVQMELLVTSPPVRAR